MHDIRRWASLTQYGVESTSVFLAPATLFIGPQLHHRINFLTLEDTPSDGILANAEALNRSVVCINSATRAKDVACLMNCRTTQQDRGIHLSHVRCQNGKHRCEFRPCP